MLEWQTAQTAQLRCCHSGASSSSLPVLVPAIIHGLLHRCCSAATSLKQRRAAAMDAAWRELDGYVQSEDDSAAIDAAGGAHPLTYGEVTPAGARRIFAALGLGDSQPRNPAAGSDEPVVFVDLGSGVAKLLALALFEAGASRAIGVEISAARHARAVAAFERLEWCLAPADTWTAAPTHCEDGTTTRPFELIHGDMLRHVGARAAVRTATHVYLSSLLFEEETMRELCMLLGDHAPHVVAIASLREFPSEMEWGFRLEATVMAQMDWHREEGEGLEVYVYRRAEGRTPRGKHVKI